MNSADKNSNQSEGFRFRRRNPLFTILFSLIGLVLGFVIGRAYGNSIVYILLFLAFGFALGTGVDYRQTMHYEQKQKYMQEQSQKDK